MKRFEIKSIGDSIREWLEDEPEFQENILVVEAQNAVPIVLGRLAKYIRGIGYRNRTLYVTLSSSAIAQALTLKKMDVIARINNSIKANLIQDIVFR